MTDAPGARGSARIIVFCVLGALCEGFDVQAAGVAAAGLSHELQPTPQALGLFFSVSLGRGLLKEHAAIAQAAFNVGGAATGLSVGVLLDSRWKRLAIALSLISLPAILMFMATCPPRPGLFIGLAFLLGGSIISQQVIPYAVASATYLLTSRGTGMGTAVAVGRSGSLVGPLVAAALLAAGRSPSQVLIGVLPIVLACGAVVGVLGWRKLALPAKARADDR